MRQIHPTTAKARTDRWINMA